MYIQKSHCVHTKVKLDFLRHYCADLNQSLYESFQIHGNEKLTYNVVNTLAPLFLIGSCSYLQVTRTFITSRTSSKFGEIGPRTAELAALERLEKSP